MLNYNILVVAVCVALESCFRGSHHVWRDKVDAAQVTIGVFSTLAFICGVGLALGWMEGWRQWVIRVLPIVAALGSREVALSALGSCCSSQLTVVYSSASMLLLAIPLYMALRERVTTSSYFAIVASLLLYFVQYDGEQACRLECLLPVFAVSAGLSLGILLFFIYGNETDGGSLAPALMTVGLLSFGHLFGGPAPFVPIILQGMNRVVLFTCIIRTSRMSSAFIDVYFAALGGSCLPEVFGGSVAKLCMVVVCGIVCVLHLTIKRSEVLDPSKPGYATGKLASLVAVAVLVFFVAYPNDMAQRQQVKQVKIEQVKRREADLPNDKLVNGVIVYMDSKRKPIEKALRLVQENFLSCWPYPVHVFKEGVTDAYKTHVRRLTTSEVSFTEIGHIFDKPPNDIAMDTANFWIKVMKYGRGHHFGYRMMCRFFSGLFAQYEFLKQYDFYWRLDTDSWIREPVLVDPFRHMVVKGCKYGHMSKLHRDAQDVVVKLYDTVLEWAAEHGVPGRNISRLNRYVLDGGGKYKRPMYYNNFEIASVPWITGPDYTSFFEYLDFTDGFMKYRWGDAPVRTLAVHLMLEDDEICDFEALVPYVHGYFNNKAYKNTDHTRPECPSKHMQKVDGHYTANATDVH